MIFIKNGDLKVAIVEAIGNLWAPKASYEINPSIYLLMKACLLLSLNYVNKWGMLL
ncbi:hypothetical protein MtrunA17_Chr7g0270261 [Medicago truncatula]|uniref:Uncharacterized protein n=1 Tax=Medicago truncatula TaxID=3880 RepID=A0A396HB69_MEDTR|nr:hypothetical protein MtrunA17_Chr7g0270261 [Medicago truncatula]